MSDLPKCPLCKHESVGKTTNGLEECGNPDCLIATFKIITDNQWICKQLKKPKGAKE